jgi:exocyst complex component 4
LDSSSLNHSTTESPTSHSQPSTKLQRYLNSLSLRPSNNPLLDEPVDEYLTRVADAESIALEMGAALPSRTPVESNSTKASQNLELDSFAYLEGLLESLGVLGKLGVGLDVISQRVQNEIYHLVDSTLEEVEERLVAPSLMVLVDIDNDDWITGTI